MKYCKKAEAKICSDYPKVSLKREDTGTCLKQLLWNMSSPEECRTCVIYELSKMVLLSIECLLSVQEVVGSILVRDSEFASPGSMQDACHWVLTRDNMLILFHLSQMIKILEQNTYLAVNMSTLRPASSCQDTSIENSTQLLTKYLKEILCKKKVGRGGGGPVMVQHPIHGGILVSRATYC